MHDTLADLKDPQARSPGLQQVNVSNSMGAPQSVMLEQLQWFAKEVLPEFNGGAPIASLYPFRDFSAAPVPAMTYVGDFERERRAIYWRRSDGMAVDVECARRLFTAAEFERMAEAGVFREDERLELIDGEIVEMTPVGPGHGASVACLNKRFILGLGDRAVVWIQSSARVALRSVPQPDLALLRPRSYRRANPTPEDILLVVEVADSSLRYDRIRKQRLYAIAGIPEYWVASVKGEWVEVYRTPESEGYRDVRRVQRDGTIVPLGFPDVVIPVADIFA